MWCVFVPSPAGICQLLEPLSPKALSLCPEFPWCTQDQTHEEAKDTGSSESPYFFLPVLLCVGTAPFWRNSEQSSVELGTVSCPHNFFHNFFSLSSSFLFYTYFLVCFKKIFLYGLCVYFFLSFFLFVSLLVIAFYFLPTLLFFSLALCVCLFSHVLGCCLIFSGLVSFLTSPFMWKWTGMTGGHWAPLATSSKLVLMIGWPLEKAGRAEWEVSSLEFTGSVETAKTSLSLPPEASAQRRTAVLGASALAPAPGMDVPVLLLASNFRKLGFLRPEPWFEKEAPSF